MRASPAGGTNASALHVIRDPQRSSSPASPSLLNMSTLIAPAAVSAASLSVLCVHNRYIQPGGEDQVFESETRLLAENGIRLEKVEEQTTYPSGIVQKIGAAVDCVWSRTTSTVPLRVANGCFWRPPNILLGTANTATHSRPTDALPT